MMFLKKIPTEEWVPFVCDKFRETGKTISEEQVAKICGLTENLSSYVQHFLNCGCKGKDFKISRLSHIG